MSDYPMLISNKLHSFRNFSDTKIHDNIETGASGPSDFPGQSANTPYFAPERS